MEYKKCSTFWVKIYLAGDINIIKQICREYCYKVGLCVTIKEVDFIYTGGEELGVEIGLINYPRFEDKPHNIWVKAVKLGKLCLDGTHQHSVLWMTPEKTFWLTKRNN